MEDTPVITEAPLSAAPSGADTGSQPGPGTLSINQIDTSKISLEQLDAMLGSGQSVEVPLMQPGGEGNAPATATPAAPAVAPQAGVTPPAVETPVVPEVDPGIQEVTETRTPEQIEAEAQAAAELIASQGGDEAAQQAAAAEAAAQPVAPAVPEVKPINRPRLDEREQLIMGVYQNAKNKGTPITLAEAEARVDGPKVDPVQVEPPVNLGQVVTDIETELTTVTQQLESAGDQLSNTDLRNLQRKQAQLDTRLELAKKDLTVATERAQELRTQANQTRQQQRDAAYDNALQLYPDAGDDTTPLGRAVAEHVEAAKDPLHPDHEILKASSAPLTFATMNAWKLGIAPKQKAAPAKGAVTPPAKPAAVVTPPPRAVMSPVPGNRSSVQPAQPAEDAKAQLAHVMNEGTLEQLDAIQGGASETAGLAALVR